MVATQTFFIFTPKIGEDDPILTSIFFRWVETQPPTRKDFENPKLVQLKKVEVRQMMSKSLVKKRQIHKLNRDGTGDETTYTK